MTDCQIVSPSGHTVGEAARVLAAAFQDQQPFSWLEPDPTLRARILPAFFEAMLRYSHPPGSGTEIALVGDTVAGCAIWSPPGRSRPRWTGRLASSWHLLRRVGLRNLKGFGERGQILQRALDMPRPSLPHWYLAGLAVHPDWQDRGVGAALMRSGLARNDAAAAPSYLECLDHRIGFYARFGFRERHRIFIAPETPEQAGMWREPSAQ